MNQPVTLTKPHDRRQEVLNFIAKFVRDNHYPPSLGEISAGCGLSGRPNALYYTRRLRAEGYITFDNGKSRTVVVLKEEIDAAQGPQVQP